MSAVELASSDADSRLHVLQIVGNAIVGGMETHVLQLFESLPESIFRRTLLAPYDSAFTGKIRALGARVHIAPINDEVGWRTLQYSCALVEAEGVDVLHTHLPNAHVLGGLVGRLTGRPVLATIHGRSLTPLDIEVQRLTNTHVAAVCPAGLHQALGVGIPSHRLHLLPIGVDTTRFLPRQVGQGPLRKRLGIAASQPVVGFVGRLSWEKGPDFFVRLALTVRARFPQARFVLVGDGPMHDELAALIERFGLEETVLLAGLQSDMQHVYPEFDLLVSSSRSEGAPFAVMEAMSCGVPVVAFSVGGVPELIEHEVSGWLADQRDVDALGELVAARLGDDEERVAAGIAARHRALSCFSAETSMSQTARLLESIVREAAAQGEPVRKPRLHGELEPRVIGAAPAVVDLLSHVKQGPANGR